MVVNETIYVLGAGAVGFPLAAYLVDAGREVIAVRTSQSDIPRSTIPVTVQNGLDRLTVPIETISLAQLTRLGGLIVITAKSYANATIALALKDKIVTGPLVILQNGVGVEQPFLAAQFAPIYRCVLYVTGQATAENEFTFRPVTASPIGVINGDEAGLQHVVESLATERFPFRAETNIRRETWKKAIINSVFNSICPLLEVDNGIFIRDEAVASLAREVVNECVALTDRLELGLSESEIMEQIRLVSQRSAGQLISTLQDLRAGRATEIEFLNLEIARVAASIQPPLQLPQTELLGKMILAKSMLTRKR
ncbi:MAG: 2-dehydropantoate 2-reductase [Anaerolineae bacterium]